MALGGIALINTMRRREVGAFHAGGIVCSSRNRVARRVAKPRSPPLGVNPFGSSLRRPAHACAFPRSTLDTQKGIWSLVVLLPVVVDQICCQASRSSVSILVLILGPVPGSCPRRRCGGWLPGCRRVRSYIPHGHGAPGPRSAASSWAPRSSTSAHGSRGCIATWLASSSSMNALASSSGPSGGHGIRSDHVPVLMYVRSAPRRILRGRGCALRSRHAGRNRWQVLCDDGLVGVVVRRSCRWGGGVARPAASGRGEAVAGARRPRPWRRASPRRAGASGRAADQPGLVVAAAGGTLFLDEISGGSPISVEHLALEAPSSPAPLRRRWMGPDLERRNQLIRLLARNGGNITASARELGKPCSQL